MGIAKGRFIVDTHVHGQRHAFKFKESGRVERAFAKLIVALADRLRNK